MSFSIKKIIILFISVSAVICMATAKKKSNKPAPDKTKEYQKEQWEKMKKQFNDLLNIFNSDEKEWDEIDKTMEEKD